MRGPAPAGDRGPERADLAIGLDIGGTKVAAGVVDGEGRVLERVVRVTPSRDVGAVRDTILETVRSLQELHDVVAVGIGAAGFVDADRAVVRFSPHLAWREEPLRDEIAGKLDLPVTVENDANAAAWAEWRFGAGRGEERLVCVTLGTGIGGAIVFDGRLQRGASGMAGEFGHMIVVPDGHRCECGNRGCWEQYASGNVLGRQAREMARSGSPVTVPLVERVGGDIEALVGQVITAAATEGDPCAVELFEDVGRWLGIGLGNLAAALDPDIFVIGGGVCDAGDLLLAPAREAFRRTLTGRGFRPVARIVRADLGPSAGLVGAADLARLAAVPAGV